MIGFAVNLVRPLRPGLRRTALYSVLQNQLVFGTETEAQDYREYVVALGHNCPQISCLDGGVVRSSGVVAGVGGRIMVDPDSPKMELLIGGVDVDRKSRGKDDDQGRSEAAGRGDAQRKKKKKAMKRKTSGERKVEEEEEEEEGMHSAHPASPEAWLKDVTGGLEEIIGALGSLVPLYEDLRSVEAQREDWEGKHGEQRDKLKATVEELEGRMEELTGGVGGGLLFSQRQRSIPAEEERRRRRRTEEEVPPPPAVVVVAPSRRKRKGRDEDRGDDHEEDQENQEEEPLGKRRKRNVGIFEGMKEM